jgi:6-phosphogluconate dehydrogenase (decarboxylating)
MVGLGLMGSAFAARLRGGGRTVLGFDLAAEPMQAAVQAGILAATGLGEVAQRCRRVLLSLPDSAVAKAVLEAMAGAVRSGQIIVDTTTGDPEVCARLGTRLSALGVEDLDATVSGNSDQVRAGETTIMVGGTSAGLEACANLLRLFADGRWELTTARKVLAQGTAAAPGTARHRLSLRCRGDRIVASLDGTPIADVRDTTYPRGLVGLDSRFHPARFDNLAIAIPPSQ